MTNPNDTLIDDILNLQNSIDALSNLTEIISSDDRVYRILTLIHADINNSYLNFLPYFKILVDNSQIFDSEKDVKDDKNIKISH